MILYYVAGQDARISNHLRHVPLRGDRYADDSRIVRSYLGGWGLPAPAFLNFTLSGRVKSAVGQMAVTS
jgi:hypothetical protein